MRPNRILVSSNGPGPQRKRRDFPFSSQIKRCVYSSAHPSDGAAADPFVKHLVCAEIWHHYYCETNTLVPLGLSCRSRGVATFPLPLWAFQSSRDPGGHRGSSAWELEPIQMRSLMNSQQEETLIKHMSSAHRGTGTEYSGLPWTSSCPLSLAVMPKAGTLYVGVHLCVCVLCLTTWCVTASDADYDVGVMCWCYES